MTGIGIIGGGHAAVQLVRRLRAGGFTEEIEILDKSRFYPYERPSLSKQALQQNAKVDDFSLASKTELEKLDVTFLAGHLVRRLSSAAGVFLLELESDQRRDFSQLVLATGVRPIALQLQTNPMTPVCSLQSWEDLLGIQAHLRTAKRVLIIGAGFVGLESASSLVLLGHEVVVVERGSQLMGRALGAETAQFFQKAHEAAGVTLLLQDTISEVSFEAGSAFSKFAFASGAQFVADLVLVCVGVEPVTDFVDLPVERLGKHILTDENGLTSVPNLFAIGDLAAKPNPQSPKDLVKIQSIDAAMVGADRLARTLLGETQSDYEQWLPKFWSDQVGQKLQISGLRPDDAQPLRRAGKTTDSFSVGYFQGNRLLALEAVNAPLDFVHARQIIQQGRELEPGDFQNAERSLKALQETE